MALVAHCNGNRDQMRMDQGLTEKGSQCATLGKKEVLRLIKEGSFPEIHMVFIAPSLRAGQTARPIVEALKPAPRSGNLTVAVWYALRELPTNCAGQLTSTNFEKTHGTPHVLRGNLCDEHDTTYEAWLNYLNRLEEEDPKKYREKETKTEDEFGPYLSRAILQHAISHNERTGREFLLLAIDNLTDVQYNLASFWWGTAPPLSVWIGIIARIPITMKTSGLATARRSGTRAR